MFIAEKKELSF